VACIAYGWKRAAGRVSELSAELREVRYQASRTKGQVEEGKAAFDVLRAHVAALAGGQKVSREQVMKGQFYSEVGALEAYERMKADPAVALIDVRTSQEFMVDHATGAVLIPLDELPKRLGELPAKDKPMLVICASGGRSEQAAEWLASQGWMDVATVRGGTASWPGPREVRTMMKMDYAPPVSR
jgi:rhodanese-related sulfurtransferase